MLGSSYGLRFCNIKKLEVANKKILLNEQKKIRIEVKKRLALSMYSKDSLKKIKSIHDLSF
jgi:hypothetical protein